MINDKANTRKLLEQEAPDILQFIREVESGFNTTVRATITIKDEVIYDTIGTKDHKKLPETYLELIPHKCRECLNFDPSYPDEEKKGFCFHYQNEQWPFFQACSNFIEL